MATTIRKGIPETDYKSVPFIRFRGRNAKNRSDPNHYLNSQVEISTSPTFTSSTSVTVSPVLLTFEVMTHFT